MHLNGKEGMKMANSTVTLKCANHRQLLSNEISKFFDDNFMVDINVTCHGFVRKAHKLILAVFCPVLKESLVTSGVKKKGPPSGEALNLEDVIDQSKHVKYLMEFMYKGQVTLPKDCLKDLLGTAHNLGVTSLIEAIGKKSGPDETRVAHATNNGRMKKRTKKATAGGRPIPDDGPSGNGDRDDSRRPSCTSEEEEGHCPGSGLEEEEESVGREVQQERRSPKRKRRGRSESAFPGRKRRAGDCNATKMEYRKSWRLKRPVMKCAHCEYETRDKGSFKSHVAKHDPTAERFVCDVCSKTFRSRRGFRCHRRGHDDPEQLHRCTHCEFYTPQKWSWLQHLAVIHRVDPGGNPLVESIRCTECDFACVAEHQLKAHRIRKHTADKPFKCTECDYSAVVRYELDKHVGIKHRNERPYMCETCGFRSQTQSGFERHKRSHTGVKPFECDVCGQVYADNRKLKSHLLRHVNDDKPFVCHLCGHACRRRDNLQMHLKRIHKATVDDAKNPSSSSEPHVRSLRCIVPGSVTNSLASSNRSVYTAPKLGASPTHEEPPSFVHQVCDSALV